MSTEEMKKKLRAELKAAESCLHGFERRSSDAAIAKNILSLEEYLKAKTVFCFVGGADEINTEIILLNVLRTGKRLCVPLCTDKGLMEARELHSLKELSPGAYGILEPPAMSPTLAPEEVEFAVIPCMSCSHDGRRLGRGGGYYDRFLSSYMGQAAVICRECMTREAIPTLTHDISIDIVVTEKGIFRRAR